MFKELFKSDKAPFVLSLTLTLIGWFISVIVTDISDVIILGVQERAEKQVTVITISNYSIKRSLSKALFSFDCGKNDCLAPNALMKYVSEAYISPYAIQGNKICTASTRSVSAILNLPPTGKAQYKFKRLGEKAPVLFFIGNTKDANCPDTRANLDTDNVWVLNELSPTIFVVSYYFPVLIILLVLTAGFLIWILFKNQEPAGSMLTGNTRHQAAEGEHKNST